MRLEVRDRPYDLYLVIAASVILVGVILILPDLDIIRIILGLPFILFFPGYVLICALYPERKRYFDKDGNEVSAPSDDQNEDDLKEGDEEIKGKGLDGLERVALSLGLSIAITPLIGLVLNYTYDWAPDTLGIRLIPILVSQFAFILVVGSIAVYKRQKIPVEERFTIVIDLTIPEDYTNMDKALTIGIAVMMVLSVGMLAYIIIVPREGESFTEFYILGPNHKAEGYPRNFHLEESNFIYIGIGNHEHEDVNYTLVLSIDQGAVNQTVSSMDNVTISRSRQPSMEISVENDRTAELQCNFSILEIGSYKLRLLLYRNGEEYRDLHIWIRVFQEEYLISAGNRELEFYMAGPSGDPSLLTYQIGSLEDIPFSVGGRNLGEMDVQLNITFTIDSSYYWIQLNQTYNFADIGPDSGAYLLLTLNSTSSVGPDDIVLKIPDGEWELTVTFKGWGGSKSIHHNIMVGDG